ncbi:cell wall-binding protein [Clostridium uliginosum]|uniref:Putative cell wall binding repeat-containing protein n=1 Tax=Clostridium uliginosum TaxID=119641 RepID=A0A1I1PXZ9_9CLOT|nr:cell wall-binding protein [Clostridium uliginosum]SFD14552.1 Putative cell wall binding repeat-containing protein [Clostridium uliginosum]
MKKKIIATLLITLLVIGITPIGVSAEWKQNTDNSWSWSENGHHAYYGWEQIDGKWYCFKDAKMQTGWLNIGYWYYLGSDGTMKTGWINDGGKDYYLKSDGTLATDTVIDGYYLDSKGVMQPKENQKVVLDNDYAKITYLGVDRAGSYSKKVKLQIENKSNQDLIIQTDGVSIDGFMVYGMFSPNITSGKSIINGIEFSNSSISTNFNNIEGKFVIITKNYKTLEKDNFSIKF